MIFSNQIAATMIGAGIATVIYGTGVMTPAPEKQPKRQDCYMSYTMPDDMAVRLIVPCEIVTNAAARSARIEDTVAVRQTMGLALNKPIGAKQFYDRLAQNTEAKNDYSVIIEKKRKEKKK